MIHSSINIANENVSDSFVGEALVSSMSSGAANLISSLDVTVFDLELSPISSTISAIAKSQTSGSPLPASGQPLVCVGCERRIYLIRDEHIFLLPFSQRLS